MGDISLAGFPTDSTIPDISVEDLEEIRRFLADRAGFHLESYKEKCIKRRITIRIRASHCADAAEYIRHLEQDELELARLIKVLTIHVSHFFRNPSTFKKLREETIPALFARARREQRESITVWSVGCSTGEEPYSLALILTEHFADQLGQVPVRLLATDINADILATAQEGLYGEERLAEVPSRLLDRYFTGESDKYRLSSEIREMVTFYREDLVDRETFPPCDLILCRNVLIYFERQQQEKILGGFAAALAIGGFLVLGKSETMVGEARKRFQTVCPVERIYKAVSR